MAAHAGGSQGQDGRKSERRSEELGVNRITAGTAFTALKLVGGANIVVVGALTLRRSSAVQTDTAGVVSRPVPSRAADHPAEPEARRLLPDAAAQSVVPGQLYRRAPGALALVDDALAPLWLPAYARFVVSMGDVPRRPRLPRVLDRFTGVVLIARGDRIALERR
jgi:threonine/homoserine/homoserine lactone efflux protein